jgi:GWxTD domain-containing protein
MRHFVVAAVLLIVSASASAQSAAAALSQARAHLARGQVRQALTILIPAADTAAKMRDRDMREQALAAIHFYTAVAYSASGDTNNAKSHLENFFHFSPNARMIDATRYDEQFVELFKELSPMAAATSPMTFEAVYSRFDPTSLQLPESDPASWGNSPAMEILASRAEKREWNDTVMVDARARFIADFWKRRDPTPATDENEFRDTFERRVAFADRIFATGLTRGATSDRGKVFVLLGEPSSVRRRPLTRHDRVDVYLEDVIINGNVEQWVYGRDQLPVRISKDKVGYRFVTQRGIGDHALQVEDVFATQALIAATNPRENVK